MSKGEMTRGYPDPERNCVVVSCWTL